jgi:hypothetical protein
MCISWYIVYVKMVNKVQHVILTKRPNTSKSCKNARSPPPATLFPDRMNMFMF